MGDSPLHLRPMTPPEPEMMSEDDIAYSQLYELQGKKLVALDEWVHWDPATGQAVKGPKPKPGKMVATGSLKATDLTCHDCGAHLVAGRTEPFHLVCGRIAHLLTLVDKPSDGAASAPRPKKDTVLECGNVELPHEREDAEHREAAIRKANPS